MADSTDVGREPDLDAPVTEAERREAAKLIMRLLGAVLAVVVAGGFAALLTRDDDGEISAGDDDAILINAIGPLQGLDVINYVGTRQKELADATGRRAAVVSFQSYMKEADARRVLEPVSVDALLVAAPGGKPVIVREELATWATRTKTEAAEERGQFEELLRSGGYDPKVDKDFIEDANLQIERLKKLEKAADPNANVVFGAAVVADAGALKRLATVQGIRLVDVGAEAELPDDARLRGIRPEETVTAGEPLTRPA